MVSRRLKTNIPIKMPINIAYTTNKTTKNHNQQLTTVELKINYEITPIFSSAVTYGFQFRVPEEPFESGTPSISLYTAVGEKWTMTYGTVGARSRKKSHI